MTERILTRNKQDETSGRAGLAVDETDTKVSIFTFNIFLSNRRTFRLLGSRNSNCSHEELYV